jgi:predicted amidophosphoribosyltransferase
MIPVPMHWTRRLKRRFNQSAELARAASHAAGRPGAFAPDLLRRTRIAGMRVLLIDDVLTTGATLNATAAVCHEAEASAVDILVLSLVSFDEAPYLRNA